MTQPALNFDGTPAPNYSETPNGSPANPVKAEKDRLNAAALRVLEYLKAHGSAVNWRLSMPEIGGARAVGRIWELQRAGYDIRKEHVSGGTWRYRYFGVKGM